MDTFIHPVNCPGIIGIKLPSCGNTVPFHAVGHQSLPADSKRHHGLCPECGKPLTIGVMNRVEELADRTDEGRPDSAAPFRSAVPLAEVLGELAGAGPQSRRVEAAYESLLDQVAPELPILLDVPLEALARRVAPRFVEAIRRLRAGQVIREGGYDGEYGIIRLFGAGESGARDDTPLLLDVADSPMPPPAKRKRPRNPGPGPADGPATTAVRETASDRKGDRRRRDKR